METPHERQRVTADGTACIARTRSIHTPAPADHLLQPTTGLRHRRPSPAPPTPIRADVTVQAQKQSRTLSPEPPTNRESSFTAEESRGCRSRTCTVRVARVESWTNSREYMWLQSWGRAREAEASGPGQREWSSVAERTHNKSCPVPTWLRERRPPRGGPAGTSPAPLCPRCPLPHLVLNLPSQGDHTPSSLWLRRARCPRKGARSESRAWLAGSRVGSRVRRGRCRQDGHRLKCCQNSGNAL